MATNKRTIRGEQYNTPAIVDQAMQAVDASTLDTEAARQSLMRLGHRDPGDAIVNQYAREVAILKHQERKTGAHFSGQIGKISFANREKTIQDVQDYLTRRVSGQRANWTASHRR